MGEHATHLRHTFELALADSAMRGDFSDVERLANEGVDIHAMNEAALRGAVLSQHMNIVEFLLLRGANVNVGGMEHDGQGGQRLSTALREAAWNNDRDMCEFLIANGAVPDFDWEAVLAGDNDDYDDGSPAAAERIAIKKLNKKEARKMRMLNKLLFCVICSDSTLGAPTEFITLLCRHSFHSVCLKKWAREKGEEATCPMCRASIVARGDEPESQTTDAGTPMAM